MTLRSEPDDNRVADFIAAHSTLLFSLIVLLYLICFNGQWRVGLDSANYRGLADSLASGRGYTFGEWAPKNIYPGYPLLLSGLQKLFGKSAAAPCIAMLGISALVLVVTYRLVLLHYPRWIAVTVTCGVATNAWFLQQTSELMTDVPFLLGVVTSLYGWDRLHGSATRRDRWRAAAILSAGLLLSAAVRPTVWVLIAAMTASCLLGAARGPLRRRYIVALAALVVLWLAFSRGFGLFSGGGYEREALDRLGEAVGRLDDDEPAGGHRGLLREALFVLNDQLPAGFFGEQLSLFKVRLDGKAYSPTSIMGSILLIFGAALLLMSHPLWALLAMATIAATLITSAEPRYYLMILPVLLVAWLTLLSGLSRRLPRPWNEVLLATGLALVTLNNLSASIAFVKEQRSIPFLEHYRYDRSQKVAQWAAPVRMAELIAEHVPPGARVIGPSGSVLSYLSGRHVYTQRELLPRRGRVPEFPRIIADKQIEYAIFPARNYRSKEPAIWKLMDRGVLRREGGTIAEAGGLRLARLRVVVPDGNWTELPPMK